MSEAPKAEAVKSTWDCGICTFANVNARTICEMCGGPGPKKPVAAAPPPPAVAAPVDGKRTETTSPAPAKTAPPPAADGPWACPACSYNNVATAYACDICATPDPNKPAPPAGGGEMFAGGPGGFIEHDDGGEGDIEMDEEALAGMLGAGGLDPAALAANPELQALLTQLAAAGGGAHGHGLPPVAPAAGGAPAGGMYGGMGGYGGHAAGGLPWMCPCGRTNPAMAAACQSCGNVPDDEEGDEYDPNMG